MGRKSLSKRLQTTTALSSVKKLLTKIVDRKPSSGKQCIAPKADSAKELMLSQESAWDTHKTICRIKSRVPL